MAGKVVINLLEKKHVGISADVFDALGNKIITELYPDLLKAEDVEVSLVFVDDQAMKSLNKAYRNKAESTDVLSFSYIKDFKKAVSCGELGDIIISADALKSQAKQYKNTIEDEAKVLFVHGFLHLIGYDHTTEKQKNVMNKIESRLLVDKSGLVQRSQLE